jgi:type I restriction enzyme, S subunit
MSDQSVKESRNSYLTQAAEEFVGSASPSIDVVSFFEKFQLLVRLPNAIERIRQLIFETAIRGKLSRQDPAEESGISLLRRVVAAKAQIEADTGKRVRGNESPVNNNPAPFNAPPGWVWTTLGSVQVLTNGFAFKSDDYQDEGVGVIRMGELGSNGEIDESGMKFVSHEVAKTLPDAFKVNPGDLLMGMSGSIGKLALNCSNKTYLLNQRVCRLEPVLIEKGYLHTFLKTAEQHYLKISLGMAIKNLSTKQINETLFPLPPLAEQKRIVAKVDELMGLCDRLEALEVERKERHAALSRAALARFADSPTPTNLKLLFHKSFDVEPAQLREIILSTAVNGNLQTSKNAANRVDNVVLGDVVEFLGGYAFKSEWFQARPGMRLVRNQNVSHGVIDWNDTEYLPDELAEQYSKFELQPGDLVLSLNRPFISTGLKLAWIREQDCPCLLVQRIACLRPVKSRLLAKYLFLWCNAPHFYRDAHVIPSSGVPYIAPNRVAQMSIKLPTLAEQQQVVAKVDELMALVDQLEQQLAHSRTVGQQLLEAVVARLSG